MPCENTGLLCCLQEALGVTPGFKFVSCSDKVGAALGPDVMKTVKPLIPDLLGALPVLLYQGLPGLCMNSCDEQLHQAS